MGKVKILGLSFGNGNLDKSNWLARVDRLEKRRNFWKARTLSMKGKSMILNTIGTSGLWYTATVLTLPGWVHTKVNRIIWDFLWAGKTEVVKHDACILPCTQGGLSVVCVKEKAKALKLRWIPLLGDITYTAKWSYFGRYWIGLRLGKFFPDWAFLRDNSRPQYFGDDRPRIYKTCLTVTDRVRSDMPKMPNFRVKTFYLLLIRPSDQLSCESQWERDLGCPLNWKSIWARMYSSLSTNKECDLAWKIAHQVLPTMARLHSWKRLGVSERCSRCKQCESISHVFLVCCDTPRM